MTGAERTDNHRDRRVAVVVGVLLAAFVFGGADQYLGALPVKLWPAGIDVTWATDVSLLSAPWLLLAFLAGWTQRTPKAAPLIGLAATLAALTGYGVMTLSPLEGAELTRASVEGFVRSQQNVILGGLVTGPLFGWLGYRWRIQRAWFGALLAASAFCLEPVARAVAGDAIRAQGVWIAEVAVGLAMVAYVGISRLTAQRGVPRT